MIIILLKKSKKLRPAYTLRPNGLSVYLSKNSNQNDAVVCFTNYLEECYSIKYVCFIIFN